MTLIEKLRETIEKCLVKPYSRPMMYSNEDFITYALDLLDKCEINNADVEYDEETPGYIKKTFLEELEEQDKKIRATLTREKAIFRIQTEMPKFENLEDLSKRLNQATSDMIQNVNDPKPKSRKKKQDE